MLHWLAWLAGLGESIMIGKYKILGMGDTTLLFGELISLLNQQGVYYLYQVIKEPRSGMVGPNWITSAEMSLMGSLATKWQEFRCAILNNGFQLKRKPYDLVWMGGDSLGRISVKNVYDAIENKK
jgi:hypothetical protein